MLPRTQKGQILRRPHGRHTSEGLHGAHVVRGNAHIPDAGFTLKELIIKEQHNCKATGYWKTSSVKYNFLLIAHEYLFVFRK